eukprot:TRINITY_DN16198_c1_g2_i1.p1 TRINITY_DN16198_c1_g2~~TRINITY_DN16198_c1_g2_i1.p1  ORF type:complete len:290 (+),score=-13.43 TRINITY_DN16198_c1_g2_i1:779-1648(+)
MYMNIFAACIAQYSQNNFSQNWWVVEHRHLTHIAAYHLYQYATICVLVRCALSLSRVHSLHTHYALLQMQYVYMLGVQMSFIMHSSDYGSDVDWFRKQRVVITYLQRTILEQSKQMFDCLSVIHIFIYCVESFTFDLEQQGLMGIMNNVEVLIEEMSSMSRCFFVRDFYVYVHWYYVINILQIVVGENIKKGQETGQEFWGNCPNWVRQEYIGLNRMQLFQPIFMQNINCSQNIVKQNGSRSLVYVVGLSIVQQINLLIIWDVLCFKDTTSSLYLFRNRQVILLLMISQ